MWSKESEAAKRSKQLKGGTGSGKKAINSMWREVSDVQLDDYRYEKRRQNMNDNNVPMTGADNET